MEAQLRTNNFGHIFVIVGKELYNNFVITACNLFE